MKSSWSIISLSSFFLLAGCQATPSSPMLALASDITSTKDVDTMSTEMAMMDSFQFTGPLGRMPGGFDASNQAIPEEIVLTLKDNFSVIQETFQGMRDARFYLALEGKVLRVYVSSFLEAEYVFSDDDATQFNQFVDQFDATKTTVRSVLSDVKTLRQSMGTSFREQRRRTTVDEATLLEWIAITEDIIDLIAPLPSELITILSQLENVQTMVASYFSEDNNPVSEAIRQQLNDVYVVRDNLQATQDRVFEVVSAIRETIQGIREDLNILKDQGISLSAADQATLNALRITIQDRFQNARNRYRDRLQESRNLKDLLDLNKLEELKDKFSSMNETLTSHLEELESFQSLLDSFALTVSTYLVA